MCVLQYKFQVPSWLHRKTSNGQITTGTQYRLYYFIIYLMGSSSIPASTAYSFTFVLLPTSCNIQKHIKLSSICVADTLQQSPRHVPQFCLQPFVDIVEVVGSSPIDPTSTVGLVTRHQTIGNIRSFFCASSEVYRARMGGSEQAPVGPESRLTDERRARRKRPYRPHQRSSELVATRDAASDKEAVFLLSIRFF